MTNPPRVTFTDPIKAVREVLIAGLSVDNSQVRTQRPAQHERGVIQVAVDGDGLDQYPVLSSPLVRVTVWDKLAKAYERARECQSILLAHNGNPVVGFKPATGPVGDSDPINGDEFASFTVTGRIRSQLAD